MGRLISLQLKSASDVAARESLHSPVSSAPPIPPKSTARQRHQETETELASSSYCYEEWTMIMDEVKRIYSKRQYKQCSARCIQILEDSKYRESSIHTIYFLFYAASSIELTARSLHVNSSKKLPLFQQSLQYYKNAESTIELAKFSVDPAIMHVISRRSGSVSSSCSSLDSVFSYKSSGSASSALPSPTASLFDSTPKNEQQDSSEASSEEYFSVGPTHTPKHVSFKEDFDTKIQEAEILDDSDLIDSFPSPPTSTTPTQERESDASISSYLRSRALFRFHTFLSGLQTQLSYHIGSINAQIHTLQTCRKARRSNLPNLFTMDFGNNGMDGVDMEELKKADLKTRIEKLKGGGWKRERFDGERYQLLAERALRELQQEP